MIAITDEVKREVEECLSQADAGSGTLLPLPSMDRHYCSLEEKKDEAGYLHLLTFEMSAGGKAFIYFKM